MKLGEPLSIRFNAAVMTMANKVCPAGWDVADIYTPYSIRSLRCLQEHLAKTGRILVNSDYSENTIFGCPEHNYAFRAWHDWTHLTIRAEFTLDGELAVAHRLIHDLCLIFGHNPDTQLWSRFIMAGVYGPAGLCGHLCYQGA